jgi:hypothetical protein
MRITEKKKILYMVLQGRLGNQLFIYFAAKFMEEKFNRKVIFISSSPSRLYEVGVKPNNTTFVLPKYIFIIINLFLSKIYLLKKSNEFIHFCRNVGYENFENKMRRLKFLNGHFQTSNYIENLNSTDLLIGDIKSYLKANCVSDLSFDFKNAISIHIRRGDYVLSKNSYFGLLSYDYYLNSLKSICSSSKYQRVYLFSDSVLDLNFKEKLKFDFKNLEIIDTTEQNIDDICTLALLSHFSTHIISNSTFSWWGAYLSTNSEIVVAPSIWFKNHVDPQSIYPATWKMIESSWE